jgi:hypothetical protein
VSSEADFLALVSFVCLIEFIPKPLRLAAGIFFMVAAIGKGGISYV